MPRVAKADHERMRQMVDKDGVKVPDVAALFGCTPATVYAILAKQRRADAAPAKPDRLPVPQGDWQSIEPEDGAPAVDLFALVPPPVPPSVPPTVPVTPQAVAAKPPMAAVTSLPRRAAGGIGGKLAKPGFGLCMRMADGEETVAPFRSLEDLLSAVKPVLRTAARSPDPVWISIRPIDLAEIDSEAA